MNTQVKSDFPHVASSLHFYWPDGRPAYEVSSADGSRMITPTIVQARKLGLKGSVTTIMGIMAKPWLERWKREQMALAALTLPRKSIESDREYLYRLDQDSRAYTEQRADEGTAIHKAIEQSYRNELFDPKWIQHVAKVRQAIYVIDGPFVGDFKTKETLAGKEDRDLFFDEHVMQLAAYRDAVVRGGQGLDDGLVFEHAFATEEYGGRVDVMRPHLTSDSPLVSIMVGVKPAEVKIKFWTEDEAQRGLRMFRHCLGLWKEKNRI